MKGFREFVIEMSVADATKLLGLSTSFSDAELKSAYKKSALKNHPDRGGSEEMMKKVNDAYETLKKSGGSARKLPAENAFKKYDDWAKIFAPAIKADMMASFKSDVWLKYFNSYSPTPLTVEIKSDPYYHSNTYTGFIAEFSDAEKNTVFKFHFTTYLLNVYKKENTLGSGDLSYPLSVWMEGYHAGRKQKFKQTEYTATSDHRVLKDPTVLVPTVKIKKMFATGSTSGKTKVVKKADIISHWKNKAGGDVIGDNFVLGNYGKGRFLRMYRFTIMRKGGYTFSTVNGKDIRPVTTFYESQLLIDIISEIADAFKKERTDDGFVSSVNMIVNKYKTMQEDMIKSGKLK
jgi:hypothetical protein